MIRRGVKDITNLGNVCFESIKDNKYTKLFGFNEVCISLPSNEKLINSMKNNIYLRKTYQESSHPIIINNVVMNYIEPKGE